MAEPTEPFYSKLGLISSVASNGTIIYTDIWRGFGVCQDNCKIGAIMRKKLETVYLNCEDRFLKL